MQIIDTKIESWKKKLLDMGKRNRLLNFKETKRSNINILTPSISELYDFIVNEEQILTFSHPVETGFIEEYNMFEEDNEKNAPNIRVIEGDLITNQTITEQQRTLKSLRNKAKTAIEEQGVNVLYLAFGFLNWKESINSKESFVSPIILVPVTLTIESLTSPYKLQIHDDEIVLNPTLKYKLENDFNIIFPDFDSENDNITEYLEKIKTLLTEYNWSIDSKVSLALFSFLKINMYMDLHQRSEILKDNFAIKALCGDLTELPHVSEELNDYEHDKVDRPIDIFQTVDADSSQQDAIVLSKKGISFVLQGPPGTGKSQTITNIISEALADGKKVLFVSEKMAALEVVYNRLSKVGLGDFCLTLHNHKANKKEILKHLSDALAMDRIRLKDEALYELEVLQKERQSLNDYARDLHSIAVPMNKSIYQVNGILAKLKDMPNIIFDFENISDVSADDLRNYEFLLDRFSKTVGKLTEDYDSNVWKGSNVSRVIHELRQDIERKATSIIKELDEFCKETKTPLETLGYTKILSFEDIDSLKDLFSLCLDAHKIPKDWFESEDIKSISDMVVEFSDKQKKFDDSVAFINTNFKSSVYELDAISLKNSLSDYFASIKESVSNFVDNKTTFENISKTIADCDNAILILENLNNTIKNTNSPLNIPIYDNLIDIEKYLPVLKEMNKSLSISELWFDKNKLEEAHTRCEELISLREQLKNEREKLFAVYEKDILSIDYDSIAKRFKTEYTGFFKIFKASYKKDLNEIRACSITPVKKISDNDALSVLYSIKNIKEKETDFSNQLATNKELLGTLFSREETNFEKIKDCISSVRTICEYFNFNVPHELKTMLIDGSNESKFTDKVQIIEDSLVDENLFIGINQLSDIEVKTTLELLEKLNRLKILLSRVSDTYKLISNHSETELSFDILDDNIAKLFIVQSIESELLENREKLTQTFEFMFEGTDTDWEEIKASLEWTGKFIPFIKSHNLNDSFVDNVISLAHKTSFSEVLSCVDKLKSNAEDDFIWFNLLYEKEYSLLKLPLSNAINKLNRCILNLSGLEEWIDFKTARKECYDNNLGNVVDVILNDKIAPEYVVSAFKKRFYKLWLDAIIPNYLSVNNFRRKSHEEMIERFKEFDLKQMNIAKLRIKESLISKLPDVNKTTSSVDEVGILKRELSKQRKIMPIRRLFARIPNLLPALKPCLMMSPLSVSLFLESELYNFDLVIFDEASQVCTENAIGAIMRAKQIIVAGDNKQLPPTNFFSATTSDSDYDVLDDDEEFEDGDYESILDEMLTTFPERSLKWHYRSKNEELITFSNVKIYNQSLITFPSVGENIPDNGVEYVYVEDGIYDRGGKKNNINEAKRVAQMVFEHFKNGTNRSIGVIAFSSSQQQAIDDEITKLRLSNPMFEPFFNEDLDEPFFVKNLENVQGDERDIIIFSIGYAKDSKGVMYMNFGPLSRNGGYRRLNVAITRAKYNIKLVGSIRPTDIKSDVNAEGVKMLRSYIEFATNGRIALESELNYNKFVDVDSPFEEAVYDFLVSKGYKITTQVGCSGYRIDMAVKHPTLDGRFVIGVECDGATYHSSRTARERDRLRQSVLEDMGWKFHRIWSTDWIKDPITEGELLVNAVENAIANYVDNFEKVSVQSEDLNEEIVEEYCDTEEIEISESTVEQFKFDTYVEANAFSARQGDLGIKGLCLAISHIIDVEYPIHYELLCKRIAPIFGNQKATVKIRNEVDYGLKQIKDNFIRKGDFFYPNTYGKIVPKSPPEGEVPRNITHISDDEIGVAMIMVASDSFGLSKINLFQIVAKEFGFNRTGANINSAFERVFTDLVSNGTLNYAEEKVVVNEG